MAIDPITAVSTLASLGSALFGGKKNRKPTAEELKQLEELQKISGMGDTVAGIGNTANTDYANYRPQSNAAIQNFVRFLERDPNTDEWNAARLAERTQGATLAGTQAQANVDANMVNRGIVGSGADTGAGVAIQGRLAAIRAAEAGNLYREQLADKQQRLGATTDVLTGAANNSRVAALGAFGQATGNAQAAAGGYGDYAARQRAAQEAAEAQRNAQLGGAIAAIGSVAAKASTPTRAGTPPLVPATRLAPSTLNYTKPRRRYTGLV